ncbi:MAG: ribose 1,5-bisphosphokinase [Halopseudomonas sp.]
MSTNESRIFYLMGPSGSGKDSLLRHCRGLITEADRCFIAHRYITREPELVGENHIWLSDYEFSKRQKLNAFAMHWQANDHRYGIGSEINVWLDQGINVLVNGSRGFLPQARQLYHHRLVPLVLQVDPACLAQRLRQRGRETESQILDRIERATRYQQPLDLATQLIENNGSLQLGASRLLAVIRAQAAVGGGVPSI